MSQDIDTAFIKKFEAEVHVAYQQQGSELLNTVRRKTNIGAASTTFQKVGKGTAGTKTRHGDVPLMNQDHSNVECILADYYAGDLVDKLDELKTNIDERGIVAKSGAWALGRKTDQLIIVDALDTATNTTSVNLSAITADLLAEHLIENMGARNVPRSGNRWAVISWRLFRKLLTIEEFKSSDYIGEGQLPFPMPNTPRIWLGYMWIPHTEVTGGAAARKNHFYHETAVGHASGADVRTEIDKVPMKAAHLINNFMSQGAVLIDNDGVETLIVDETA